MIRAILRKMYPRDSGYQIERKVAGVFFTLVGVALLLGIVAFIMVGAPGLRWKGTMRTSNAPTFAQ